MTDTLDLANLHLDKGQHDDRDDGVCLMEAVAWFAGKDHTDHPPCVSPVLGAFGRAVNDAWDDAERQKLIPFITRLPGTAGDGRDETRGYLALDWLIRTYTVAWLGLAGLAGDATALQELEPILSIEAAKAAGPVVRRARGSAAAAWAAAWDAARDAAGDAAWDAARAAAGDAARAAAWAKLQPVVDRLQASALELFGRMITGEPS